MLKVRLNEAQSNCKQLTKSKSGRFHVIIEGARTPTRSPRFWSGHSPSGNSGIVQSPIPHARRQRANLDEIGKSRSAAAFLPEQTLCWSVNSIRADFETETKVPGRDSN